MGRPPLYLYAPDVEVAPKSPDPVDAAEVLRVEAHALLDAAERLDGDAFQRAVDLILCPGRVIVTGAGTSGIVARKIAATLTSTGTPALFLHPSDALHGGLGAVAGGDVVVAVSNSGETGEILVLLPYLRNRQASLIAIVGNSESRLGREADVVLDAMVKREAGPYDLAPTASSTLALAMGDALAMSVLQVTGFTPDDFALNHPSGRLGRRLTLRVADLMHERPGITEEESWLDVVGAISDGGLGGVAVVDGDDHLLGIITDGDVRRMLQRVPTEGLRNVVATAMMTPSPVTVDPELLAYDALQRMEDRPSQISVLPVVSRDGRYLALIRVHDIVRAGI